MPTAEAETSPIRIARESLGWTQLELARRMRVKAPAVSRLEARGMTIGLKTLLRAYRAMGLSVDLTGTRTTRSAAGAVLETAIASFVAAARAFAVVEPHPRDNVNRIEFQRRSKAAVEAVFEARRGGLEKPVPRRSPRSSK